jgi:hypothetical protein
MEKSMPWQDCERIARSLGEFEAAELIASFGNKNKHKTGFDGKLRGKHPGLHERIKKIWAAEHNPPSFEPTADEVKMCLRVWFKEEDGADWLDMIDYHGKEMKEVLMMAFSMRNLARP